ncbi:hypothetical protein E2C01_070642 [Portunus trituberculatus]|uniref:Uncharacterized protein n=1 Tax=Portunus trituberculatus TaxID=210409 RepID=A0A5B7I263_PORTR|nr:hypothetical protein [Portunus trituberculatus]
MRMADTIALGGHETKSSATRRTRCLAAHGLLGASATSPGQPIIALSAQTRVGTGDTSRHVKREDEKMEEEEEEGRKEEKDEEDVCSRGVQGPGEILPTPAVAPPESLTTDT